ncbi:MAG: divalent-cation tolerance protein CutA [Pseudomonadota bacterium]
MNQALLVLTTFPDIDTAQRLAEGLVQANLAACVNIMPAGQSTYMWQGKLCKESEHLAVIKTMEDRYQQIEIFIKEQHPYELPEIISTLINNGSEKYLDWLSTNTRL